MKKRGQASEFLAIVLLLLIITVFALLTKLSHINNQVSQTKEVIKTIKSSDIQLMGNTLPRLTVQGVSFSQLLGDLNCYGNDSISYGDSIDINLTDELRKTLDAAYGKNNWVVRTTKAKYIMPKLYFYIDNSGSMKSTEERVEQVMALIAHNNKNAYEIETISSLTGAVGKFSKGSDDLACGRGGDTHEKTSQGDENWGGAAAFIANNGNPPLFDGWNDSEKKVVILSSDEESCSSSMPLVTDGSHNKDCARLCSSGHLSKNCKCNFHPDYYCSTHGDWKVSGGMIDCKTSGSGCHNIPGNTTAYVDFAIKRAKKNNVSIFFIIPNKIYVNDEKKWVDNVHRMCDETGGSVIDLRDTSTTNLDIGRLLMRLVIKNGDTYYITSTYEGTKMPKVDGNLLAYNILFPLPCDPKSVGKATLLVKK